MQDYYEELWRRLPDELAPPDFELRRDFLLANIAAGERVLDLGCGAGEFTAALAQAGAEPLGLEVAQAAIDRARARRPDLRFEYARVGEPLPLQDNSFDAVWASEVIEHVADTAGWLSEVRRVLVPRGRLLLTTPAHGRLTVALGGVEQFSQPLGDHLHLYTRRSLHEALQQLGFGEIEINNRGGPPFLRRLLLARAVR